MEVILAKTAGFCPGVRRAVETVYEEADKGEKPVDTFGPIIHNEEVVRELERKGVHVVEGEEGLAAKKKGTLIIRSHGVSEEIYRRIEDGGYRIVDATCPYVLRIHRLVREYSDKGYWIVIAGSRNHPEVEGICGWADRDRTTVIADRAEAEKFDIPCSEKLFIVAQTTFNYNKFQDIVEIISKKGYDKVVRNTICRATEERQREAAEISARVDAMIVIGGKNSSNSRKLFEICSERCVNTYFIQTKNDLDKSVFQCFDYIGITAGASTPNYIIEEVLKYVGNGFWTDAGGRKDQQDL